MTEFHRSSDGRIQADLALHAGKLLCQYERYALALPPAERLEGTLTICVLQTLLTNCSELLKSIGAKRFEKVITDTPAHWSGLSLSMIKANNMARPRLIRVLEHMRNAVSHPSASDEDNPPATGYTTVIDSSGLVSMFRFTDSPWVRNGAIFAGARSDDESEVRSTLDAFEQHYGSHHLDVAVRDGAYGIYKDGSEFLPVFTIEVPLTSALQLAKALANYLAQPTNARWDGVSVDQLVAC